MKDGHVVVVRQVHGKSVFKRRVLLAIDVRSKSEEVEPKIEVRMRFTSWCGEAYEIVPAAADTAGDG